jgi:hypothetical protein
MTSTLTRTAGRARLSVTGPIRTNSEGRHVWRWSVAEVADDGQATDLATGEDLHTGVGMTATPEQMLATLCTFLGAAAESHQYAMRHGVPLAETENGDLFDHAVMMLASQESDEIAMLAIELEEGEN